MNNTTFLAVAAKNPYVIGRATLEDHAYHRGTIVPIGYVDGDQQAALAAAVGVQDWRTMLPVDLSAFPIVSGVREGLYREPPAGEALTLGGSHLDYHPDGTGPHMVRTYCVAPVDRSPSALMEHRRRTAHERFRAGPYMPLGSARVSLGEDS